MNAFRFRLEFYTRLPSTSNHLKVVFKFSSKFNGREWYSAQVYETENDITVKFLTLVLLVDGPLKIFIRLLHPSQVIRGHWFCWKFGIGGATTGNSDFESQFWNWNLVETIKVQKVNLRFAGQLKRRALNDRENLPCRSGRASREK